MHECNGCADCKAKERQNRADRTIELPDKQIAIVVRQILNKGVCDKECWMSLNAALELRR